MVNLYLFFFKAENSKVYPNFKKNYKSRQIWIGNWV